MSLSTRSALLGAAILLAAMLARDTVAQQSRNVQLLGTFAKYVGRTHNDVWAFTAANGKEYCLLGVAHGVSYLDCSNPAAPQELAFFPGGGSSTWRDMKVYGGYGYCVTERRDEGMMILDLRNPQQPRFVKFWTNAPGKSSYRNCHNIGMDFDEGIAYLCGTARGTVILDVKTDPENPIELATFAQPYLHDITIQDGLLHGADIYGNNYRIWDVSNPRSPQLIGTAPTSGTRYFHNTWPSRDNQICLGTNEASGGPVSIFDISNPQQPKEIALYRANPSSAPSAIAHNAHVRDRIGHISYYTEGLRILDVSDPSKPVEVGYYDTWSGSSTGYNGNWGATPALDSGNVYVSDISSGLYIVRPLAATEYYGAATPDQAGNAPQIGAFGSAYLGNASFGIELWGAGTPTAALLLLGAQRSNINFAGLQLNVELGNPAPLIFTSGTSPAGGAMQPLPIPSDSKLSGLQLHAQWMILNPSSQAQLGFTATRGASFELFAR
jgi:choice-of-anchor B domain-containing protein